MPIKKTLEMAILGGSALALSALALSACTRDSLSALRGHPDAVSYDGGSDRKDTNDGVSEGNDGGTDASDGNFDLFDAGRDVPPKCPEPWLDCPEDGGFGDAGDAGPSGDGGLADGSTDAGSADASDGEVPTDAGTDSDGGPGDGSPGCLGCEEGFNDGDTRERIIVDVSCGYDLANVTEICDCETIIETERTCILPEDLLDIDWAYRRPFIAWQTGDSPLSNIPFLVNRAEGTFYIDTETLITEGKLQLNCDDLRFAYPGGPIVPFEFENRTDPSYGCDTPNTALWTRADLPASPLEQTLYMYYGNPGAPDGEDRTSVWDPSYAAIWHFGEGSGVAVNDSTINGNNGSVIGAPSWIEGYFGKAMNFDGIDDRVEVPNNDTLNFGPDDSFTLEAWVRYETLGSSIIQKMDLSSPSRYELFAESGVRFFLQDVEGDFSSVTSSTEVADGNWHYVAAVRDRSSETIKIYIDGLLNGTETDITNSTLSNSGSMRIGYRVFPGGTEYFNGGIDEVRISRIARPPEEIKRSYEQGLSRLEAEEGL